MSKTLMLASLLLLVMAGFCPEGVCAEKVLFGFEQATTAWTIPDWCLEKVDCVTEKAAVSKKFAKEGSSSLEITAKFPGKRWTGAYVEVEEYFNFTPYKQISADIFLPKEAPFGLKAKFILTVGEDWEWTEMSKLTTLVPGEWKTITASLIPGSNDWRQVEVTDAFRADVRKIGIRVDSNNQPVYSGPIYIDNIRLE